MGFSMNPHNSGMIRQERDLLFKAASMTSTTKEFVPLKDFVDAPARRLGSLMDRLQAHGSCDAELTRHFYILNLGREIVQHLTSHEYKQERMQELLFLLYLTAIVSYFSLVDRFGLEDDFGEKFPNRTEAILWGWTLKGSRLSEGSSAEMIEKIRAYYQQQGMEVSELHAPTVSGQESVE
jgi:hypothetical protein